MIEVKCKCGKSKVTFMHLKMGDIADGQAEQDCCAMEPAKEASAEVPSMANGEAEEAPSIQEAKVDKKAKKQPRAPKEPS